MFFTVVRRVVLEGFYDGSNYCEPTMGSQVLFAPTKIALFKMLREVGFSIWDIRCIQVDVVPGNGDAPWMVTFPE